MSLAFPYQILPLSSVHCLSNCLLKTVYVTALRFCPLILILCMVDWLISQIGFGFTVFLRVSSFSKTWMLSIVSSSTLGSHSGTVEQNILRLRYEFVSINHINFH